MRRLFFLLPLFAAPAAWIPAQGLGDFGSGPPPCRPNEKPTPSTPEAFGQHLSGELKRWTELVERIGLKVP